MLDSLDSSSFDAARWPQVPPSLLASKHEGPREGVGRRLGLLLGLILGLILGPICLSHSACSGCTISSQVLALLSFGLQPTDALICNKLDVTSLKRAYLDTCTTIHDHVHLLQVCETLDQRDWGLGEKDWTAVHTTHYTLQTMRLARSS